MIRRSVLWHLIWVCTVPDVPIQVLHQVAVLFLLCYERNFMMSLSEEKQSEVVEAFSSTSRYLDDLLDINNKYFDGLISQIYPSQLQ